MNAFPDMDASTKDRLKVDEKKIGGMIQSLRDVAELPDPEGKILYGYTRPDGLRIENRSVPFGTILIIYESRPDVTIEAAATAFKAGNRILLKGGKESLNTNMLLTQLWQQALHGKRNRPKFCAVPQSFACRNAAINQRQSLSG